MSHLTLTYTDIIVSTESYGEAKVYTHTVQKTIWMLKTHLKGMNVIELFGTKILIKTTQINM